LSHAHLTDLELAADGLAGTAGDRHFPHHSKWSLQINSLSVKSHVMVATDPSSLLPEVISKVTALEPAHLGAVHQFLLRLELGQLTEEILDQGDLLRKSGRMEPNLIEEAIKQHRGKHPYPLEC